MREDRLLELADVASGQWGLFTSAQAKALGVTPQQLARLANSEVVERLRQGVYRLAGVPEDRRAPLRAAWLALDPGRTADERYDDPEPGVVSHRSAAWLHDLGDLEADDLEFSVPARRQSRHRETRFHVRQLKAGEWELVGGLPTTTVVATVRDLAAAGIDGGHLAGVVRDALVDAHTEFSDIAEALRPYAHRYGSRLGDGKGFVEDLLEQAGVPTSTLETAAAVTAHQSHAANDLLASPAVAESLRYLQSPALQQSLAQLSGLAAAQNAAAALAYQTQQLLAPQLQQYLNAEVLAESTRQLALTAGAEAQHTAVQAMADRAAEAASQILSNPLREAAARLVELHAAPDTARALAASDDSTTSPDAATG